MMCTCVRREARRGPLRGEGLRAVGQQRVEVGHMRVLHHRHIVRLETQTHTEQVINEDAAVPSVHQVSQYPVFEFS